MAKKKKKKEKRDAGCNWTWLEFLEKKSSVFSSGILTGLHYLDQVFWFFAVAMVLPHPQVEFLQFHCVLFGVEERAADSLSPNTRSDHLQAKEDQDESDIALWF